jgi:hypothetical protein
MRRYFTLAISLLLGSCLSESNVDPGSSSTFIRYYNGGNDDVARSLERTPEGGYAIVATTRRQKVETDPIQFRIKFIKTDAMGNPEVPRFFPADFADPRNFQASSIHAVPTGGYIIVGDDIQANGTSKSLLIYVDANGDNAQVESFDYGSGKAGSISSAGSFLMLTTKPSPTDTTMYLLDVAPGSFTITTATAYPAGETSIASKLLVDETGKAIWSGVVKNSGLTGIRVLKTITSNANTEFDRLVAQPGFDLVGTDICKYGLNYAVIGSTNRKPGQTTKAADTDILFVRMGPLGDTLSTKSFPLGALDNQNDVGNAINSTQDGGLILLSSVSSLAIGGRGDQDFYLIRIDPFGNTLWTNSFGSRFKDEGTAVLQASDGGYVILGTTTQGALKIITLLKTDKDGKIE